MVNSCVGINAKSQRRDQRSTRYMTIKIGQPYDEEYLEYLISEYSRTDPTNDLPSWAYSKKEWEQKLLYRTYLRNKIRLVKKELREAALEYYLAIE